MKFKTIFSLLFISSFLTLSSCIKDDENDVHDRYTLDVSDNYTFKMNKAGLTYVAFSAPNNVVIRSVDIKGVKTTDLPVNVTLKVHDLAVSNTPVEWLANGMIVDDEGNRYEPEKGVSYNLVFPDVFLVDDKQNESDKFTVSFEK